VGHEGAGKEIRIEAGADPQPFDLTMAPWPGLRGTVLDPERQPVARVRVRAINTGSVEVPEVTTDAAGRYAFERLRPGLYHFLALPPQAGNADAPMQLAPTWYPGVSDQRDAPAVSLAPGGDLTGHDINLRLVPVFRISGRVLDERGEPAAGATVQTGMVERKDTTRRDGTFDLTRVLPGEGVLSASWQRGDVMLRGFAKVVLAGHDVEDIAMRLAPPLAVTGDIELDGERHPCEGEAILTPVEGQGERAHAEFSESGIRFKSVYPGRYRLTVLPGWMSRRHYLESVRLGEWDITMDEFEVEAGMTPFRVVLRTGGGRLQGMVENGNGGMVVLTPRDERLRFRPFILVEFLQSAAFSLDNVRPGDYYAFALQGSFNSDQMQNPGYARPYLNGAKTVRLERGSTTAITLGYVKATSPE